MVERRPPMAIVRTDKVGTHRSAYNKNKKRIMQTENTCGICGHEVDFSLKAPNPLSPVIDHIIPISKGGHPSDLRNLQLAHWHCNRQKSDKLFKHEENAVKSNKVLGNRVLPLSTDWVAYRPSK